MHGLGQACDGEEGRVSGEDERSCGDESAGQRRPRASEVRPRGKIFASELRLGFDNLEIVVRDRDEAQLLHFQRVASGKRNQDDLIEAVSKVRHQLLK
jgi:hypothetical protein